MRPFNIQEFFYQPSVGEGSFSDIAESIAVTYRVFSETEYSHLLTVDEMLYAVSLLGALRFVHSGRLPIGRLVAAVKSAIPYSGEIKDLRYFSLDYLDSIIEIRTLYDLLIHIEQLIFEGVTGADEETAIQRVYVNIDLIQNVFFGCFSHPVESPLSEGQRALVEKASGDYVFRYLIHCFSRMTANQELIDRYEEELENLKAEYEIE